MGSETDFCYCTCPDYCHNRLICKHFFAIFESQKASFQDLTPLFRNHVLMTLDEELFNIDGGLEGISLVDDSNLEPMEVGDVPSSEDENDDM